MATVQSTREGDNLDPEQIVLVRHHLEEVLTSLPFAASKRAQDFLQLVVGHALEGQADSLRERMIGVEMFGRPIDYDTGNDPVVRVKAREVRGKLAQFYSEAKEKHPIRIELPSGHYVPQFHFEPEEPVAPPESGVAHSPASEQPAGSTTESTRLPWGKLRLPLRILGGALGLVLLAIACYMGFKRRNADSIARGEIRSIAVLPLENLSGDRGQEYLADGMTEELINSLGQVSTLRVISLTSAMSYKGTKKKLPEIARELNVDGVVEGAVQRNGNQVRVSAQLIDARTDRPIWAHAYIRDFADILALQGEVARAIANEVSTSEKPGEISRFARAQPVNADAEDLYLLGMFHLNANDFKVAVDYFQKAIEAYPNYAQAHAALANCYGRLGEGGELSYNEAFLKQKTEASKAIELDDSLPEGHAELANAAMNLNWDWGTAVREFSRAQEINPSSASVHERYAVYLERTGRLADAMAEVDRGVELDPISARAFRNAGFTYYFSRRYDQSLLLIRRAQALNRAHALNIDLPDEAFLLGDIYAEEGMYAKSISEFQKSGNSPHVIGHLGNAYARAGQTDAARKTVRQLEEHVRNDGVGEYEIALVYAGLGKKNEAFTWLEASYKAHSEGLTNLKIDPCLDPLRSDPRFNDLVRRVGLTP